MKQAIIKALCYADVFNYPLTAEEIHQQLTRKTTLKTLASHLRRHKIKSTKGFYYLPGRKKLISRRLSLSQISQQKLLYTKSVANWLKLLPSVSAVYLTGALAMNNSDAKDDIDLMIITKPGYLWTTRFVVNSLLDILGLRRKPSSDNIKDKLCLNLWLDESSLTIKPSVRSLYMAHEIVQAKLIWQRKNVNDQFLFQNRWVHKYLPNALIPTQSKPTHKSKKPNIIESILKILQNHIMKPKQTSEVISDTTAFFHPRNTNQIIMSKYKTRINHYLKQ